MCPGSNTVEFSILVSRSEADDFLFEVDLLYDQWCSYIIWEEMLHDVFLVCCTICALCVINMGNITLSLKKYVGLFSPSIHPSIYNELMKWWNNMPSQLPFYWLYGYSSTCNTQFYIVDNEQPKTWVYVKQVEELRSEIWILCD